MALYWATWSVPADRAEHWGTKSSVLLEAENDQDAREQAEKHHEAPTLVAPVETHPVCGVCTHHTFCMSNKWNERGSPTSEGEITSVHTCATCGMKTLSTFREEPQKRLAPTECPRWNPCSGSACDCNACMHEKMELGRIHPAHETLMQASRMILKALLTKGEGQDTARKDALRMMAEATTPMACMPVTANYNQASLVLGVLMASILSRQSFQEAWEGMDEDRRLLVQYQWLEALQLALGRHKKDVAKVVHEFLLTFTETMPLFRAWYPILPEERKAILRTWEARVSTVLTQEQAEA